MDREYKKIFVWKARDKKKLLTVINKIEQPFSFRLNGCLNENDCNKALLCMNKKQ